MGKTPERPQQKLFTAHFTAESRKIEIEAGSTILQAAAKAGIALYTACGGRGTCGKCIVRLAADAPEVLACQCRINSNIEVFVPPIHRQIRHRILHHGIEYDVAICPAVRKVFLKSAAHTPAAVIEALSVMGGDCLYSVSDSAAQSLAALSRADADKGLTAVCRLQNPGSRQEIWQVVDFEKGNSAASLFGVALDIGTTTIVAALINLATGAEKAIAASLNPQNAFGDDVISRITHAHDAAGLRQLHDVTIAKVNELIAELCRSAGISTQNICELSVVGNTTMNHIFLGLPIEQLGRAPYNAWSTDASDVAPSTLGIDINPAGNVHAVENIAGFVGADTVGAALAVRMDQTTDMTLVIDIGTNGELILGTKDRMVAASCAAGPAFEGAKIAYGSRAMQGAIERVSFNSGKDDIEIRTIDNLPPVSICGSGLIDAVGVLLELGIVEESGRFIAPDDTAKLPPKIRQRLIEHNGQGAFVLARRRENNDIVLTQRDLREVQLAKAAIRAGIKLLQAKVGIDDSQIEQYLIAGAFGNYIDPSHAMRIGLLPSVPLKKVKFVGNAAASGAKLILLNHELRKLAGTIARNIRYVEIGHEKDFENAFTDCLMF